MVHLLRMAQESRYICWKPYLLKDLLVSALPIPRLHISQEICNKYSIFKKKVWMMTFLWCLDVPLLSHSWHRIMNILGSMYHRRGNELVKLVKVPNPHEEKAIKNRNTINTSENQSFCHKMVQHTLQANKQSMHNQTCVQLINHHQPTNQPPLARSINTSQFVGAQTQPKTHICWINVPPSIKKTYTMIHCSQQLETNKKFRVVIELNPSHIHHQIRPWVQRSVMEPPADEAPPARAGLSDGSSTYFGNCWGSLLDQQRASCETTNSCSPSN